MLFQKVARVVTGFVFRIIFNLKFEGTENVPSEKGFMVCSNHRANLDPIFVAQKVKCHLRFMAKIELFKNKFAAALITSLGAFPVERGKGDMTAINTAENAIKNGDALVMFPEGTRSKDGKLLKFKSGAVMIAGQTGADILPVGISFSGKLKFRTKVTVRYGKLIKNEELKFTSGTPTPSEIRYARNLLQDRVAELID